MQDAWSTPYGMKWHQVEFDISQLMGVPLNTHALGTRLYISEWLSSLLRYDMAELWETGESTECGLWRLQNGIGVFHYVG